MLKQGTKSALWSLAILGIGFVGYCVLTAVVLVSKFAPDEGVGTYWELKEQGVPLFEARRVTNPPGHFCVFADAGSVWWTFPSGPPAYLFDQSGTLVEYTLDIGDSAKFQDDYAVYTGEQVSISQLEAIFSQAPE